MERVTVEGFFAPAQRGEFFNPSPPSEQSIWADTIFKLFFKNVEIEPDVEKNNLLAEIATRVLAGALLILVSPVLMLVSLAIKISMPGDIFYKQRRVGKNGKLFFVYKFRSMVEDAEEKTGHTLSWEGDPRVTWSSPKI